MTRKSDGNPFDAARENLNTMRGRIEEILRRLGQLAEGKDWAQEGELGSPEGDPEDNGVRGVYGFSVRIGTGGAGRRPDIRVEPFGTVRPSPGGREAAASKGSATGKTSPTDKGSAEKRVPVREVREPLVDVIDEEAAGIVVIAELPGVAIEQLEWELGGDVLTLHAEAAGRTYHKEVLLPAACTREGARLGGTNGVIELRLRRAAG